MRLKFSQNIYSYNYGMSKEEFKNWLKSLDRDGDGKLEIKDLRRATRDMLVLNFSFYKAWRAMQAADLNGDGYIHLDNDGEVQALMNYARNKWGIVINDV
ncbi:EF-hand-containing protein [Dioscorea alata]|uniref:EF-hand-containing protein n=1 Tax=Dioscorea alata TaxID=55571 RepID=A0ACB7VXY1_DIOAL|nr:EF-hand-containing protein [Dioscorea alata]